MENFVRPACTPQEQTLLLSQQGRNNARALTAVPSDPTTTSSPDRFRVTLCRRLRLPFLCLAARCEGCGALLDEYGDHYAACMRSGRVQARAKPAERAWERVLKEARQGTNAAIHAQHLLRNTTLPIRPTDNRRIDLLVTGFPFHSGKPLFCDVTMRSPLKGNGQPHPKAARTGGAVLKRAERDKQTKYGDVEESPLAELLVLGCEVGGRWNETAVNLVRSLAKNKVQNVHPLLRKSAELAFCDRWWSMLGVATQDALAASLLATNGRNLVIDDSATGAPELDRVLDCQRWAIEMGMEIDEELGFH